MSQPGPLVSGTIHTTSFCNLKLLVDDSPDDVLSENLAKVTIKSNIDNGYPIIQLFFYSDNQKFIEENIYLQKKITLKVQYTDENGIEEGDPIIFQLMVMEHDLQLPSKKYNNVSDHTENQRRMSCATCVCIPCFKILTAIVNRLWDSDGSSDQTITPFDAVKQLAQDAGVSDSVIIDKGKNDHKLDQLLIPPMSFGESLNYINNMYGIFDNECLKYIDYNGTFRLYDLVKYYEEHKNGDITLHKLPIFAPKEIYDPPTKKAKIHYDHFVCYDYASTVMRSNDSFVSNGYKQTYIYHPFTDIAYYVNKEVDEEALKHGFIPGGSKDLKIYKKGLSERYVSHCEDIGMMTSYYAFDPSERLFNRRINREMMSLNFVKFNVNRKIKIHYLIKPGETVYFKSYSEHEHFNKSNYDGTYIIMNTTVTLSRFRNGFMNDSIVNDAEVVACRTVQSFD